MKTEDCLSSSKDDPDSITHLIPAINFHLWQPCNFRCKFCFAGFDDVKRTILPKGHLPQEQAIQVVLKLAQSGFKKITFAGGETTLCPWLPELVKLARESGLTTGIITNGSRLSRDYLSLFEGNLDWVGISIDSLDPITNQKAGRSAGKHKAPDETYYRELCKLIQDMGFKLKLNTVVHAYNRLENIAGFINEIGPLRWKLMQILPVNDQNDEHYAELSISKEEFNGYVQRNTLSDGIIAVVEDNDAMRGSYLMVDPAGRFYDNVTGGHRYSQPILEVGVEAALAQIEHSFTKFLERGGQYDWR